MRNWMCLVLLALVGCARSPFERQVRARNWPGLEQAIGKAESEGNWSTGDARDLAHEILASDLQAAPSAQSSWVAGLQLCSSAMLSELKSRAQQVDDVGAAAMRILEDVDQV